MPNNFIYFAIYYIYIYTISTVLKKKFPSLVVQSNKNDIAVYFQIKHVSILASHDLADNNI